MPPRKRATATVEPSPEAVDMVMAGAAPVAIDADAMLKQIRALQAKVDGMTAAQGTPADPVAAAMQNLRAHFKARHAMHRRKEDLAELGSLLDELDDDPHVDDTAFVVEVCNAVSGTVEGVEYLRELARDLHNAARHRSDESEEEEDSDDDDDGDIDIELE